MINFYRAPCIGKVWRSQKGFLSGHLYTLQTISDEMAKCDLNYDERVKIFLWKNTEREHMRDVEYLIKLLTVTKEKQIKTQEEMQEDDLIQRQIEEARKLPITF